MASENNLEIKLGKNKETPIGLIQNFEVYFNNEKITNDSPQSVAVINKSDMPIKIDTNYEENEPRYISPGQAYVGNIFIKENYQRKGLSKSIYQALANETNAEIVKGDPISNPAKKMWESFPDKFSPKTEEAKE